MSASVWRSCTPWAKWQTGPNEQFPRSHLKKNQIFILLSDDAKLATSGGDPLRSLGPGQHRRTWQRWRALAALCPIWLVRESNSTPPAPIAMSFITRIWVQFLKHDERKNIKWNIRKWTTAVSKVYHAGDANSNSLGWTWTRKKLIINSEKIHELELDWKRCEFETLVDSLVFFLQRSSFSQEVQTAKWKQLNKEKKNLKNFWAEYNQLVAKFNRRFLQWDEYNCLVLVSYSSSCHAK